MAKRRLTGLGIAIAAAGYVATSQGTHAQDSDDVTIEIGHCVELESPEERRACYGARVDAAVQERERATTRPAPESRSSNPGDDTRRSKQASRDGSGDQPAVVAKIAALRETVPNSYQITLDNDQVWRQIQPKWHPLRVGQEVKIHPTGWGPSFRLSADGLRGYIQVERVR
jgi:hypothetical protein